MFLFNVFTLDHGSPMHMIWATLLQDRRPLAPLPSEYEELERAADEKEEELAKTCRNEDLMKASMHHRRHAPHAVNLTD